MRRDVGIPTEFASLHVEYVQKKNDSEYSGNCPECGGAPHSDGEWPDRFIMLLKSSATGGPFAWCRNCGWKWWPGKDEGRDITPEQRETWRREAERRQDEERKAAEDRYVRVKNLLEHERLWERYYENLLDMDEGIKQWQQRGIGLEWASIWQLGYNPDCQIWHGRDEAPYRSPSLTIPVFAPGAKIPHNINNRILQPPTPAFRYYTQFAKLPPLPWLADPAIGYDTEFVMIVEGEIKGMHVYKLLDNTKLQVVGVQGKNGLEIALQKLQGRCPIICLDPDATQTAITAAKQVGGARVLLPQGKIDDLILAGAINKSGLRWMINTARVIK